MPKVRSGTVERWQRRAAQAAQDYAAGVQAPRVSWRQATAAAEAAWQSGVQQAVSEKRWTRGVERAGDSTWQRGSLSKGVERFPGGVGAAGQEYAQAVAPYLQVIEATQLPPRGPKGDPRNIERVRVLADALRKAKLARVSGRATMAALLLVAAWWCVGCSATVRVDRPRVSSELVS